MITDRESSNVVIANFESRYPGKLKPVVKTWIQSYGLAVLITDPVWALCELATAVSYVSGPVPHEHRCNRCGGWGGENPTPLQRISGWKGKLCSSCREQNPDGEHDHPPQQTTESSSRVSELQAELTFAAELLGTADPEQKDSNGETAVDALIRISRDPSAVVREGAVYGMARRTDVTIVREQLEKLAADDPSPVVRGAAGDALATARDAASIASRPGEELSNARLTIDALLRRLSEVMNLSNRAQTELARFALLLEKTVEGREESDSSEASRDSGLHVE